MSEKLSIKNNDHPEYAMFLIFFNSMIRMIKIFNSNFFSSPNYSLKGKNLFQQPWREYTRYFQGPPVSFSFLFRYSFGRREDFFLFFHKAPFHCLFHEELSNNKRRKVKIRLKQVFERYFFHERVLKDGRIELGSLWELALSFFPFSPTSRIFYHSSFS